MAVSDPSIGIREFGPSRCGGMLLNPPTLPLIGLAMGALTSVMATPLAKGRSDRGVFAGERRTSPFESS